MTIRAAKFTPEVLLSAPRRSAGVPDANASKVLYSVSTYNFSEHARTSEIHVLDVQSEQTRLITDAKGASDPLWLDDDTVILLSEGDGGVTSVKVGCALDFGEKSYEAGQIPGPVGNLRVISTGNGTFGVAVTGKATPRGELYNPEKAEKPHSSGRLYKKPFVRHWDHYVTENRNAIFLATLTKKDDKYKLSELTNAVKGSGLESPVEPFGGTDNFDISVNGLVFTAKDPDLDPATHTKTNIYLMACPTFWSDLPKLPNYFQVPIFNFEGASTSPVWDQKGTQFAFLSMKKDGYESDKNQVFIVSDYRRPGWVVHLWGSSNGKGLWDRSPQSISWGTTGELFFTAEEHGRMNLYTAIPNTPGGPLPTKLVSGGAITSVNALPSGVIFLSSTSLIENSMYSFVPPDYKNQTISGQHAYEIYAEDAQMHTTSEAIESKTLTTTYISSSSRMGSMFGLSRRQIDEIHWKGANKETETKVHAWVVRPSTFDAEKKYPLAFLVHGGPQGAWLDSWSTRWNPAVFAEQGYVVVCPNPTGSTGYGQDFVDAIQGQWGGLPYEDLVLGFDYIEKNMEYVDINRAVALGASYGGYMMNWIQGHELGRKFKALVTHDGVFSMTAQMASEELYFPFHEFKGALWENPEGWAQWDPSRFADKWATPHLIIHSDLDYRLTMNEGLSAFNVLQTKGVPSQLLTFPDENHWVLKPENSLMWHTVVFEWINSHVGLDKESQERLVLLQKPVQETATTVTKSK